MPRILAGDVRVFYDIKQGSVTLLSSSFELAAGGTDFDPAFGGHITIADGENSGTIVAQIKQDELPEVDEAFIVQITQLQLMSDVASNFQPVLGEEIWILPG